MNKLVLPTILAIWMLGGAWWYKHGTVDANHTKVNASMLISQETDLVISSFANLNAKGFLFQPNQYELSVLGDVNSSLVELAYLLKNSRETFLCLTGRYNDSERNFSSHENLGVARAEAIKKNLEFWGAPSEKIEIASIEHINNAETGHLVEGINYQIDDPRLDIFAPLNLYFKANKYKIKVTDPIMDYISDLKAYLDQNPDKKVYVTGHSYEGSSSEWNQRVSRYRAAEVSKMMVKLGIDSNRLETDFKGKSELFIDETASKEEKAKNRRVEVRIK